MGVIKAMIGETICPCPYCGKAMNYQFDSSLMANKGKIIYRGYFCCTNCHCRSPVVSELSELETIEEVENEARLLNMERVEPKNRVLTLEELKVYTGFLWKVYNGFDCEGAPAFVEKGFIYAGNGNVDLKQDISDTYGKNWRCWLRKPTKEEMEGTPWEA